MKRNFLMKLLSFVLAVLAVVMLFPYGTLTAYATDNNPQSDELPADETSTDSQNIADPPEGDEPAEPAADGVELETEVLYYEYEIENTAMPAPPMTNIGGSVDPNALELKGLADGVYAIENVGNDNYFMSVQGGYIESGYRIQQQNYGSNTPLTDFSGLSLFKVSRIGTTNKYIIRSMLGNRMSFGIESEADGSVVSTQFIDPDDSKVTDGYVYTITYSTGGYLIKPYGNSKVITAPNSTASGDAGGVAAQLFLSTQSEAGNRGKWKFIKYTGNTRYGVSITRTAGMGNGIVKGKTGTIWVNSWSTVIGANTPYIAVDPGYTNIASSSWTQSNFSTKVTAVKCGDFQMKSEIRTGSSTTATHTLYSTYTVIPDIVGDTAFVQNVATGRYMEVESASTANGGIVQQWQFHTGNQAQWIFELGGSGYFKIKNVNSGRYLGVDSSDITKVKQYSTVTDYTLWKLTETSNGRYKISCKASALSGKVLSTPSSTSANGVDLTMLAYVSNSDYKDEWKIYDNLSTYYGTLQYWNDDNERIGYWASPPSLYVENMTPSSQFYFESGISSARTQWSSALNISFPTEEESGADIKIYGLSPTDYYNETGTSWPNNRTGYTISSLYKQGYAVYQGNIKRIDRRCAASIYIIYRPESPRAKNETMKTVVHELGHALGYSGHSPTTTDVMYAGAHSQYILSSSEINHLCQIYTLMN